MANPKIKRPPMLLADYIIANAPVSDATDMARELIADGYEPWGSPVLTEMRWLQVFIKKQVKEIKDGNTAKEH